MDVDNAEPITHPNDPQPDEASISFTDANFNDNMAIHDNPTINRDEIPPNTSTHQRDEDSPPRRVRQSFRAPKYSERFLEWKQSLARKQATDITASRCGTHSYCSKYFSYIYKCFVRYKLHCVYINVCYNYFIYSQTTT
jgi:hypothetical protein